MGGGSSRRPEMYSDKGRIARIRKILSGIDDSREDEAKLSMVRGLWDVGRLATQYKQSTGMMLKEVAQEIIMDLKDLQRYTYFFAKFPKAHIPFHSL